MKKTLLLSLMILSTASFAKCVPNYYKADTYKHFSEASAKYLNYNLCNVRSGDTRVSSIQWDKNFPEEKLDIKNNTVVEWVPYFKESNK